MGAFLSLWMEGVGGGGLQGTRREWSTGGQLAPHWRWFHGSVSGEPGTQLSHLLAV